MLNVNKKLWIQVVHQAAKDMIRSSVAYVNNKPFHTYGHQTFLCSHQRQLQKLTLDHHMQQQAFLGLVRDPVVKNQMINFK